MDIIRSGDDIRVSILRGAGGYSTPWNQFLILMVSNGDKQLLGFTLRHVAELRRRAALEQETIRGLFKVALDIESNNKSLEPLRAMLLATVEGLGAGA